MSLWWREVREKGAAKVGVGPEWSRRKHKPGTRGSVRVEISIYEYVDGRERLTATTEGREAALGARGNLGAESLSSTEGEHGRTCGEEWREGEKVRLDKKGEIALFK